MAPDQIAHPRPKHTGTKQMFDNPWLERLTRTHIAVPVTVFVVYSLCLLVWCLYGSVLAAWQVLALFPLGLFAFTLIEYAIHRYFYHMEADTERGARLQYHFHGVHHEYPKDKDRLAMPPWLSIGVVTLLLWGLRSVAGDAGTAFFSGFVMGYALYLLVHYAVHAFTPPNNAFKVLWVNHAVHHYKDQHRAFGVSSPLWDYVFRTMP